MIQIASIFPNKLSPTYCRCQYVPEELVEEESEDEEEDKDDKEGGEFEEEEEKERGQPWRRWGRCFSVISLK